MTFSAPNPNPGTRATAARLALLALAVLASASVAAGCRESRSEDPPVHLNPNMDNVAYVQAQEPVEISIDGYRVFDSAAGMRPYVEGTVAAGDGGLRTDSEHYEGKAASGAYITTLPNGFELSEGFVRRGQQRYEIYCTPCHDGSGSGNGIVVQRGFTPPPTFHDDTRRSYPIGKIYEIIAKGGEAMPSYAAQIPVGDRWAIAAYVRSLQFSHGYELQNLPDDQQTTLKGELTARRLGQMSGAAFKQRLQRAAATSIPDTLRLPQQPGGSNP